MGSGGRPRGSEEWPQIPAFCGIPADAERTKKNVPTRRLGGGRGTVVEPSPPCFQRLTNHTDCSGCCLENPGRPWRSSRAQEHSYLYAMAPPARGLALTKAKSASQT